VDRLPIRSRTSRRVTSTNSDQENQEDDGISALTAELLEHAAQERRRHHGDVLDDTPPRETRIRRMLRQAFRE
jgi:hypothetical protein